MFGNVFVNSLLSKLRRRRAARQHHQSCSAMPETLECRVLLAGVTWVGGATGNWNVAANWSTGKLPTSQDSVTIDPAGASTVKIIAGDGFAIAGLTTGADDTLTFTGGTLTINGAATVNGPLTMSGGALGFSGAGANATINGITSATSATFFTSGGGKLTLPNLTTYVNALGGGNGRLFQAEGAGSVVSLPALTSVTNTGGGSVALNAFNGGRVDLSALTKVANTNGTFHFDARTKDKDGVASTIDVSNLPSFAGIGNTLSLSDGAVLLNPKMTTWTGNTILISGSPYTFSNFTSVNNSNIVVSGGGSLTLPGITTYTNTLGGGNGRVFKAEGKDSKLSFPALTTVTNTGGGSVNPQVFNGGRLDLPALTAVVNTNGFFNFDSRGADPDGVSSVIDVSNLPNFAGTGNTLAVSDTGVILFPKITSWLGGTINGGGAGSVYDFSNLTLITNTNIVVSGGASLTLPGIKAYINTTGGGNGRVFLAEGGGSVLSFPALATITNQGGGSVTPRAINGGKVDLKALTSVVNTSGNFHLESRGADGQLIGSVIDISNLPNFAGTGNFLTLSATGEVLFDKITSWVGGTIAVSGAPYTLSNLILIDNTTLVVTSLGNLTLPSITGFVSAKPGGNSVTFLADGSSTQLKLPGLVTATNQSSGVFTVRAVGGGNVELAALTTVDGTSTGGMVVSSEGTDNQGNRSQINLPALATLSGAKADHSVRSTGGATVSLPVLKTVGGVGLPIDVFPGSQVVGPAGAVDMPASNSDGVTVTVPLLPAGVDLNLSGGTYSNLTVDNPTTTSAALTGGTYAGTTTVKVGPGGTFDLTGGLDSTYNDSLVGSGPGTVTLTGGNLRVGSGGLNLNLPGSMFQWSGGNVSAAGDLTNQGGISLTGTGTRHFSGAGLFKNEGNLALSSDSALNVQGAVTLSPSSSLTVDVASASKFGKLSASGPTNVAGTLNANLIGGFAPAVGAAFPFLAATNLTGSYPSVNNVTAGGSGVGFTAINTAAGINLVVSSGGSTTTPGTAITVTGNGQGISDGATTTSAGNSTAFGTATVGGTMLTQTFTISNGASATAVLTVGTVSIGGANAGDFKIVTQPGASVAAGTSTTFTVEFKPTANGTRTATISFTENDPNVASPFTFDVSGVGSTTATGPTISVTGNGQAISDGAATSSAGNGTVIGTAVKKKTAVSATFTVSNDAGATIALTLGAISLTGKNAADFTVTKQPDSSVAPGASTTFTIQFKPTAKGDRTATVSFTENDASLTSPFTFAISGLGLNSVASTKVKLTSNAGNPVVGDSVVLTASVTTKVTGIGQPTGVVTFKDGKTVLGTGTLTVVNGQAQATFTTTTLSAGNHSISATYEGTEIFKAGTGKLRVKVK